MSLLDFLLKRKISKKLSFFRNFAGNCERTQLVSRKNRLVGAIDHFRILTAEMEANAGKSF